MAFDSKTPLREQAPKIGPWLALLVTTLLSLLLVGLQKQSSVGKFRDAVLDNPGTASFVRQLVASILGTLWIYSGATFFNLTTRQSLATGRRTPTLHSLNVWAALGSGRFDLSLSPGFLGLSSVIIIACHAIGSLWGGAIAPIPSAKSWDDRYAIVPLYESDPSWAVKEFPQFASTNRFDVNKARVCQPSTGEQGFIPTCPVPGESLLRTGGSFSPSVIRF